MMWGLGLSWSGVWPVQSSSVQDWQIVGQSQGCRHIADLRSARARTRLAVQEPLCFSAWRLGEKVHRFDFAKLRC